MNMNVATVGQLVPMAPLITPQSTLPDQEEVAVAVTDIAGDAVRDGAARDLAADTTTTTTIVTTTTTTTTSTSTSAADSTSTSAADSAAAAAAAADRAPAPGSLEAIGVQIDQMISDAMNKAAQPGGGDGSLEAFGARIDQMISDAMALAYGVSSGVSPSLAPPPQNQMSTADAAGTLAAHMRSNGLSAVNVNDLYKLATNPATPPRVAEAAQYLLNNPEVYKTIETNDVANADGISGVANLEKAATGQIPGLSAGSDAMSTADAAGTLASYMRSKDYDTISLAHIYDMAKDPATPPRVVEACQYLMENLEEFKKIETNDAPNVDGISGVANFEKAAKGEIAGL